MEASKIINLPIAALDKQSKIGQAEALVIDPDNGQIIAILIKQRGFFKKKKIISYKDILEIDGNGIVIKNEEALSEIEEIVRAKKTLEEKITVLDQKAQTKSAKNLGRVNDILIETETMSIIKYYLRSLWEDRIFPADKVMEITKKAVIFSDDVIEVTPLAEAEGAAA